MEKRRNGYEQRTILVGHDHWTGGRRRRGHERGTLPPGDEKTAHKVAKHVNEAVEDLTEALGM